MRLHHLVALVAVVVAPLLGPTAPRAQTLGTYDAFGHGTIDPSRWRGYEHTVAGTHWRTHHQVAGGQYEDGRAPLDVHADWWRTDARNTERQRTVENGVLRLALTTAGYAAAYAGDYYRLPMGRIGLRVADPALVDHVPSIRAFTAAVTIDAVHEARACASAAASRTAAGLVGVFFNDGSSTSGVDRTGDVMATLMIEATPDTSGPFAIVAHVWRCTDRACDLIQPLGSATFTRTASLGAAVVLGTKWQPERSRFLFTATGGGGTAETKVVGYSDAMAADRPVGFAYDVRLENRPAACPWAGATTPRRTVSSETRIDNVRLDEQAAAEAR